MPQKSWAVGEEVLAADFNSYLQNQVVPQFTSTTQRDTQWPSPPNGAVCVTADTGTFWQRIGGVWYKPFAVQGRAVKTADQTGITTIADITGLSATVTLPAGRLIRVSCEALLTSTVVADVVTGYITDGANAVQGRWAQVIQVGSGGIGIKGYGSVTVTPVAGTYTYKARVDRGGTGTATLQANTAYPAQLVVEDLGAA